MFTLKEHLDNIRPKAHETQLKNGHYKKMSEAAAQSLKKKKAKETIKELIKDL